MGFWNDFGDALEITWEATKEVAKFAGKITVSTATAGAIVSTVGLAAPLIGSAVLASGKIVEEIGKDCDCEFVEGLGNFIEDVGLTVLFVDYWEWEQVIKMVENDYTGKTITMTVCAFKLFFYIIAILNKFFSLFSFFVVL